jgi:hypothetical protein
MIEGKPEKFRRTYVQAKILLEKLSEMYKEALWELDKANSVTDLDGKTWIKSDGKWKKNKS